MNKLINSTFFETRLMVKRGRTWKMQSEKGENKL